MLLCVCVCVWPRTLGRLCVLCARPILFNQYRLRARRPSLSIAGVRLPNTPAVSRMSPGHWPASSSSHIQIHRRTFASTSRGPRCIAPLGMPCGDQRVLYFYVGHGGLRMPLIYRRQLVWSAWSAWSAWRLVMVCDAMSFPFPYV